MPRKRELDNELTYREATYKILAAFFAREPTIALLESLRNDAPAFDGPLKKIALQIPEGDLSDYLTDLNAEYARFFLNMSRNPISLYESVYVSDEKVLMRGPHDEMKRLFDSEGIAITGMDVLPEDHLAKELLFMSALIGRAKDAEDEETLSAYMEKQTTFFEDHLEPWVPELMSTIRGRVTHPYYGLAGELGEKFMAEESAYLKK